ncbi:MAG: transporter substrate-binding domain-containing protein [Roseateles sp.]|nr:MAG: transporter substrate-binding domain-containing protein [Roseateles sp.]
MGLLALTAQAQDLTLRTVQQAGALVKYDPASPLKPGLCLDILRAVERVDPGLRFTGLRNVVPLKRVERLLADGEVDVFFCLLRSPDRERQWRFLPVPLYGIRQVVVLRADDPRPFDSLADLARASLTRPVLVARGTILMRRLDAANVQINEVNSEREALQMLMMGRTDAVYGQDINLLRHIREAGLDGKLRLGRNSFGDELHHVAVRSGLPAAQQERLTQALRKLERDGVLKQLADQYR